MQDIFSKINQRSAVLSQPLEPFVEKIITYLDEEYGSFNCADEIIYIPKENLLKNCRVNYSKVITGLQIGFTIAISGAVLSSTRQFSSSFENVFSIVFTI